MNTTIAMEQIVESIKQLKHTKLGRFFLTCRNGIFLLLPQEEMRTGDPELFFLTDLDISCGLSNTQWWSMLNAADDYTGGDE